MVIKTKTKYLILALLMMVPLFVHAAAIPETTLFTNDAATDKDGLAAKGKGLQFRIVVYKKQNYDASNPTTKVGSYAGAVITGLGSYDLAANGGHLYIPTYVTSQDIIFKASVFGLGGQDDFGDTLDKGGALGDDVTNYRTTAGPWTLGVLANPTYIPVVGIEGDVDAAASGATNGIYNNPGITSVTFPPRTLNNPTTGVTFGDAEGTCYSLQFIGDYAFYGCTGLKGTWQMGAASASTDFDLTDMEHLFYIGAHAFDGCTNLTGALKLPAYKKESIVDGKYGDMSIDIIGDYAFNNCQFTGTLIIPTGVYYIGDNAFHNNSGFTGNLDLSKMSIDSEIAKYTKVNDGAFKNCTGMLGKLTLPTATTFTEIGNASFQNNNFTQELTIPTSVTSIGQDAFQNCKNLYGSLNLSTCKLKTISIGAFKDCIGMDKQLTLPTTGTLINLLDSAFTNCNFNNDDLQIPASVQVFSAYVFQNNKHLRGITFGAATLTFLGNSCFDGDEKLEYVNMLNLNGITLYTGTSLSRNDVLSPFGGTPAHTIIYLDKLMTNIPAAPDNYNYALEGTLANMCQWLYIQSGCDYYFPVAITASKATYNNPGDEAQTTTTGNYTLAKGKYSSVYLPYSFKMDLTDVKGYSLLNKDNHNAADNTDNMFIFLQNETGSYDYHTPYVVTSVNGGTFPEMNSGTGISIPASTTSYVPVSRILYENDANGVYTDGTKTAISNTRGGTIADPVAGTWGFYGTTETITRPLIQTEGWNTYVLNSGTWFPYNGDLTPFHTFLAGFGTPVGAKPTFMFKNLDGSTDTTNGIDGLSVVNQGDNRVYNMSGQYLGNDINALPKGLYIVNGKKIIKK